MLQHVMFIRICICIFINKRKLQIIIPEDTGLTNKILSNEGKKLRIDTNASGTSFRG